MIAQIKKMHTCINIGFEYYYVLVKNPVKYLLLPVFSPRTKHSALIAIEQRGFPHFYMRECRVFSKKLLLGSQGLAKILFV